MDSSDAEISDVESQSIKEEDEDEEKVSEGSEAGEEPQEEETAEEVTGKKDEPHSARLARTIFIGNLKANLEIKVVILIGDFLLIILLIGIIGVLKLGAEKDTEAIWKCGFNSHPICCPSEEYTFKEGGIPFVSYNDYTMISSINNLTYCQFQL